MSHFYLVRHGANDYLGKALAGRLPNVHLNEEGRRQAAAVAGFLAKRKIHRLFSSPLERTRETAEPVSAKLGLKVEVLENLNEVEFGKWSGRTIKELESDSQWKLFNTFRSGALIPEGEHFAALQGRIVGELARLHSAYPDDHMALFSHGDVIRSALVYFLGMPIDFIPRLEISPGSVTILRLEKWGVQVLGINLLPEGL
jgi:broad specificity phosphatase PhoE